MKERQCRVCGEWKPRDKFGKDTPKGRMLWCRECKSFHWKLRNSSSLETAKEWILESQGKWGFESTRGYPAKDRVSGFLMQPYDKADVVTNTLMQPQTQENE